MKDTFDKMKGYFKIQLLDDNNKIVDTYEDNNLIMDTAKLSMAQTIGRMLPNYYINEIRLGGEGVKPGTYITKDASDGFVSSRSELFAEQNNSYVYSILFNPTGINGMDADLLSENDNITGYSSLVNIASLSNVVTFTTTIPKQNANNNSIQPYSEAGLYISGNLFAMKVFPTRLKNSSLKMIITWSIIF